MKSCEAVNCYGASLAEERGGYEDMTAIRPLPWNGQPLPGLYISIIIVSCGNSSDDGFPQWLFIVP